MSVGMGGEGTTWTNMLYIKAAICCWMGSLELELEPLVTILGNKKVTAKLIYYTGQIGW